MPDRCHEMQRVAPADRLKLRAVYKFGGPIEDEESSAPQSRLKNAAIKIATKLVYKYKARSGAELYNLCTSEEWASLIYANLYCSKDIQVALDLFFKDSLELQCSNRWKWLLSQEQGLPEQETEIVNCLLAQEINPVYFVKCVRDVLQCNPKLKINCIKLLGLPNSGKSLIAQLICRNFICSYNSNHGSEESFFSNFLNRAIVLCEELYITKATVEDYKSILGGAPLDIEKKHVDKQILCRTPIIITSNYILFGRGYLAPVDENAFTSRCYYFEFTKEFKPSCTVTASAMASVFKTLYENK
ncbi:hypothetical protein AVEN_188044-1 [Araneus ventricosus]|uniref:SF3 helicase domain-containing protein n=1 Tax=Araneus ventricosus TaxID=182803 RepID=A0A4Y2V945_ARAVE|nr:hypothetical protein AVEN_188044-1 [Araneus ventricosus]